MESVPFPKTCVKDYLTAPPHLDNPNRKSFLLSGSHGSAIPRYLGLLSCPALPSPTHQLTCDRNFSNVCSCAVSRFPGLPLLLSFACIFKSFLDTFDDDVPVEDADPFLNIAVAWGEVQPTDSQEVCCRVGT